MERSDLSEPPAKPLRPLAFRTLDTAASQPVSDRFLLIPRLLLNLLDVSAYPVTEFVSFRILSRAYDQCWDLKSYMPDMLP